MRAVILSWPFKGTGGGLAMAPSRRRRDIVTVLCRALICFLTVSTSPVWARGPLLLPDSPPPNLATLDTEALRAKATKLPG